MQFLLAESKVLLLKNLLQNVSEWVVICILFSLDNQNISTEIYIESIVFPMRNIDTLEMEHQVLAMLHIAELP